MLAKTDNFALAYIV